MLLWADPDVAVTPFAEIAELLHLWVIVLLVVLDGEARRIVHAYVTAETEENARCLVGKKLRERPDSVCQLQSVELTLKLGLEP